MLIASISIFTYLTAVAFFFEKDLFKFSKTIIFFSIYISSALFLMMEKSTAEILYFLFICVLWIPLSIDDLKSNSVNRIFLYLASFLSCVCLFIVREPIFMDLFISPLLVLVVFLVAWMIKNKRGREAIGPADYLAIFSLSFSLLVYTIGIWVILFSLFGMIHYIANSRQSIPLIPFLFSTWCLVFAYF